MNHIEFRKRILAANDAAADALRERFADAATLVLDVVSSPGAGKTSLLESTAKRLSRALRLAAIVGDVATELDARRLAAAGLPAHQVITGGACHLDARMVREALPHTAFPEVDLLFIENVGNLVCPASYALGDDFKVALLSVTEGHDKPFKYPAIFSKAAVVVITKVDLLPHVSFDVDVAREQILLMNPDARVLLASVVTGEGLDAWCGLLTAARRAKNPRTTSV